MYKLLFILSQGNLSKKKFNNNLIIFGLSIYNAFQKNILYYYIYLYLLNEIALL